MQILQDKLYKPDNVVLHLAIKYPEIFIECVLEEWQRVALPHLKNNKKISAIKEVCFLTGWGTEVAKGAVDKFQQENPHLFVN